MAAPVGELTRKASDFAHVLELTLAGKTTEEIREATRWHHIEAIRYAHGYPDLDRVRDMWHQFRMLKDLPVTLELWGVYIPQETRTGARP